MVGLLCTVILIVWDPATPPSHPHAFWLIYEVAIGQPRYRRQLYATPLGLTVVSVVDPQTILLALNQLPVHGDLHVQRRLRLQQGLKGCQSQSTQIYRVPQCMSPRWNWDSPTPSLASELCPSPPEPKMGGGHIRLRVRGWGSPNSDEWRKSLALNFKKKASCVTLYSKCVSESSTLKGVWKNARAKVSALTE